MVSAEMLGFTSFCPTYELISSIQGKGMKSGNSRKLIDKISSLVRRIVIVIMIIAAGFWLLNYSVGEDQFNTYPTMQEARESGSIERGWIPEVLPESTFDISEWHNLDVNEGHGKFRFEKNDVKSFEARIQKVISRDVPACFGVDPNDYDNGRYAFYLADPFLLAVDWKTARGEFWIDLYPNEQMNCRMLIEQEKNGSPRRVL